MNRKRYIYHNYKQYSVLALLVVVAFLPKQLLAQNIDSLKLIAKNSSSNTEKAEIYNKISNLYLDIDLNKARTYVDSALELGEKLKNHSVLSNAYVNYANAFYYEGNLDSTLVYFKKSYNEITKTSNNNEIAASLNRLGLVYEAKSNYSEATKYYFQALQIYEETHYKPGLANIYNNLGIVNDAMGNKEKSIANHSVALELFLEINDLDGQANVYNNLATIYAANNELEKAISYLKTSIQISRNINNIPATATAYYNTSTFYEEIDKSDSARFSLDSALVYYSFTNNMHGIANVYAKEASFAAKQKKFYEAIKLLHESLKLREKVGNLISTAETLKQLSDTYLAVGNYEKALETYKSFTLLEDSIFNIKSKNEISEINIKYESEKKDKAIGLLKKESEIKQFQTRFLFFLTVALAVISLLLLYLFSTKSKFAKTQKELIKQREVLSNLEIEKQQTEKQTLENEIKVQQRINELQKNELERSERELITSTMQVLNKNKLLSEIKESFDIIKPSNNEAIEVVNNISKKLKANINLDEDWEQFKLHFEKVNTGFFEKLQKQYPELSAGDLKVCAYIKINLSSKEIAQIMNISSDGINKRLYRIRKKINLSQDTNLSAHLAEF